MPRMLNPGCFKPGDVVQIVATKEYNYWSGTVQPGETATIHPGYTPANYYVRVVDARGGTTCIYWNQIVLPANCKAKPRERDQDPKKPRLFTKVDEAIAAPVGTPRTNGLKPGEKLKVVNVMYRDYGSCCGHHIYEGFHGVGNQTSTVEEMRDALTSHLASGLATGGILTCTLIDHQEKAYGAMLRDIGFKLLSRHRNHNYPAPHDNWLYGYVKDDHEAVEGKRTFA